MSSDPADDAANVAWTDEAAAEAVVEIDELATTLVEADRWTAERAEQLLADVLACGPSPLQAALRD